MEFLRLGSRIPGASWGCCAFDVIQNFEYHPDEPASIELVCGDDCLPLGKFLGKTYREIFESRLVIGTFSDEGLPNHGFLAVITESQIETGHGLDWLEILKKNGFEFIRAVANSVYDSDTLAVENEPESLYKCYLFGLFRNVGKKALHNPHSPPETWLSLPSPEVDETTLYTQLRDNYQYYTREELEAEGVPIWLSGRIPDYQQELADNRERREKEAGESAPVPVASPW